MAVSLLKPLYDLLLPRKRRWTARHWRWFLAGGDTMIFLFTLSYTLFLVSIGHVGFPIVFSSASFAWNPFFWEAQGCLAWLIALHHVRPYAQLYMLSCRRGALAISCTLGVALACWLLFLSFFLQGDILGSLPVLLPFVLILLPTFGLWRACYASILKIFFFQPLTVIVGASTVSDMVMDELCQPGKPELTVLGYVDESICIDNDQFSWPVLGSSVILRDLIASGLVDLLVVSPDCYGDLIFYPLLVEAQAQGVQIFTLADFYECVSGKCFLLQDSDLWQLVKRAYRHQVSLVYRCWRRALDLGFGVVGLTLLLCLLPLITLLICLDSPGPVFYWQERVGYHGRCFRMLKIRSMRVNSEPYGEAWASLRDTRVTRVGRILRATHLDELPQVLNILRGEMSLIGPRPERPMFVSQLEQFLPVFHCRLGIKPGLTGWAQVKLPYASSYDDAAVKLQYDLYYIQHQSFVLDISILLHTVVEVLWCSGR